MNEKEVKDLLEDVRKVAKKEAEKALKPYMKVSTVTVISSSGGNAVVRLPYSKTDGTEDFTVPIVGFRSVAPGDSATIGYWCNISTAVLLSGGAPGSGGGPGTSDYNVLQNKPQINAVELLGNKTSAQLGLQPAGDYATRQQLDTKVNITNGYIGNTPASLDNATTPGHYLYEDFSGIFGVVGRMYDICVSVQYYGASVAIVQTATTVYTAGYDAKCFMRSYYYANVPTWRPWQQLATTNQLPNRNLLDNWDFRNPVNQREITTVTGADSQFLIDRFRIYSYFSGSASVSPHGITINGSFDFGEVIETSRLPETGNITITMSALLSDGSIFTRTHTFTNTGYESADYTGPSVSLVYLRRCQAGIDLFFMRPVSNVETTIKAVKLEMGSVSTLANDPPANYGEELAKCQRYLLLATAPQILESLPVTVGLALVPTPVTMRVPPAVVGGISVHSFATNVYLGNTVNLHGLMPNGVLFHTNVNEPAYITFTSGSGLSAEL